MQAVCVCVMPPKTVSYIRCVTHSIGCDQNGYKSIGVWKLNHSRIHRWQIDMLPRLTLILCQRSHILLHSCGFHSGNDWILVVQQCVFECLARTTAIDENARGESLIRTPVDCGIIQIERVHEIDEFVRSHVQIQCKVVNQTVGGGVISTYSTVES